MKNLSRLALVLFIVIAALASTASAAFAASRLVYSDEFNGPLDTSVWTNDTPWDTHYTTGELEYYDPANCTFANGFMTLKSERRSTHGYAYASGIVTSLPRPKFSYGYFEIRAKLPKGQGIWPAWWLTNDSTLEIDGLELLGNRPTRIYHTLHVDDSQIYQGIKDGPDYSAGMHTYGIDWQPTHVKWYIDGVLTASYVHAMPSDPLWICINTAVGGAWPGSPTASTQFPVTYDVDYIRVYDTKPLPNTAPVANANSYSTANATALTVSTPGLLGNDSDAQGDSLTASIVAQPAHGTVSVSPSGSFTYRPEAGFSGADTFTYRAFDGSAYSSAATVSITVAAPPVLTPVAFADTYSTPSDATLTVSAPGVLANDTDAAGKTLVAIPLTQPANGTVTIAADGSFAYVPATGFSGTDSFTYLATDDSGVTDAGTVSLSVVATPVVTPPTTVVTKPVVTRRSRKHRTYNLSGVVRVSSTAQVVKAAYSAAAETSSPEVVAHVQIQRLVRGRWRMYSAARVANATTRYKTVVRLRTGVFRARTFVTENGVTTATSSWSKKFRVR